MPACETGSVISPFYDSMIAKLIAHGADRAAAIARLARGARGNGRRRAQDQRRLPARAARRIRLSRAREMDTGLIGRELASLAPAGFDAAAVAFGVMHMLLERARRCEQPAHAASATRPGARRMPSSSGGRGASSVTVLVDGVADARSTCSGAPSGPSVAVPGDHAAAAAGSRARMRVVGDGNPLYVLHDMRQTELALADLRCRRGRGGRRRHAASARPSSAASPRCSSRQGDTVAKGDRIAVVEAMKMEHVLHAARAGRIDKLAVEEGQQVTQGALIAALE